LYRLLDPPVFTDATHVLPAVLPLLVPQAVECRFAEEAAEKLAVAFEVGGGSRRSEERGVRN
jgi:hypothetical protein